MGMLQEFLQIFICLTSSSDLGIHKIRPFRKNYNFAVLTLKASIGFSLQAKAPRQKQECPSTKPILLELNNKHFHLLGTHPLLLRLPVQCKQASDKTRKNVLAGLKFKWVKNGGNNELIYSFIPLLTVATPYLRQGQ